jgi:hypothetical protein
LEAGVKIEKYTPPADGKVSFQYSTDYENLPVLSEITAGRLSLWFAREPATVSIEWARAMFADTGSIEYQREEGGVAWNIQSKLELVVIGKEYAITKAEALFFGYKFHPVGGPGSQAQATGACAAPLVATFVPTVSQPKNTDGGTDPVAPPPGSLYDLWLANGRPERIGYAATGGAVEAGARWVAGSTTCCAGGAMGLYERDGRLYGRWCGIEGVAYAAESATTINGAETSGVVTQTSRTISVPRGTVAGTRAWLKLEFPSMGSRVVVLQYAGTSVNITGTGRGFFEVATGETVTVLPGFTGTGTWRMYLSWPGTVAATDLSALASQVAELRLGSAGVPWTTAQGWSRAGEWVRRKAWADSAMMLRHEAGPGSARAVAVFKSASVTVARAVRSAEFGVAEWAALDWVLKYPPADGDVDLTDAVIGVDAAQWALWKSGAAGSGGGTGGTEGTEGTEGSQSAGFLWRRADGSLVTVGAEVFSSGAAWSP